MYVHAHVTHTNRLLFKKDLPETTGKKKKKVFSKKIIKNTSVQDY